MLPAWYDYAEIAVARLPTIGVHEYDVGRPGLEPGTLGLKVPCSTR